MLLVLGNIRSSGKSTRLVGIFVGPYSGLVFARALG